MYIIKNCPCLGAYDNCEDENNFVFLCKECDNCLLKQAYESSNKKEIFEIEKA